jgi:uncharacterized protein (TIGR02246 family)
MRGFLVAGALLALAGCVGPGTDGTQGIARSSAEFEAAFKAGDAARLAALFTADGAVLAPNLARMDGRPDIQALWQNFFDAGVTGLDMTAAEVTVQGVRATEIGAFTLTGPDGKGGTGTVRGKYLLLWQRQVDGSWLLHRDIWNYDSAG